MAGDLLRVNSRDFEKAAKQLAKAGPKVLRAMKKELRAEAAPLGTQMTAGLADAASYAGGLGSVLTSGKNYTKLVFRRDNATVSLNLRLGVRHPLFGMRDVWLGQEIGPGSAAEAFDRGVDKLQNSIANAATKAVKESL
jgi:plasmid stabilization system protein ParE